MKPVNVTPVGPAVAVESKVPLPAPASATLTGRVLVASALNNPVKTAAVASPWVLLATSGNTSIEAFTGPPVPVKLPV